LQIVDEDAQIEKAIILVNLQLRKKIRISQTIKSIISTWSKQIQLVISTKQTNFAF